MQEQPAGGDEQLVVDEVAGGMDEPDEVGTAQEPVGGPPAPVEPPSKRKVGRSAPGSRDVDTRRAPLQVNNHVSICPRDSLT